jgi:hypothetical protein
MPTKMSEAQQARAVELMNDGWTNAAIAGALGVGENTIWRYLKGKRPAKQSNTNAAERKIVCLQDKVTRLEAALKAAHRQAIDDDKVAEILDFVKAKPVDPPNWLIRPKNTPEKPEVPVTIWSDWHAGETVSKAEVNGANEFNLAICEERIRRLVERTVRLTDKHNGTYPGLVLNLLGDFVSGGLHPELLVTDEIEVLEAMLWVKDILAWAVGEMVDRFGQLYIPCASGNHGRQTKKPEFKRYIHKNFDTIIYKLLERHFRDDKRIRFDIRESNEVLYRVFNKRFLAMHGDMLGVKGGDGIIGALGPISRGEVKVRGSSASIGRDYDVLLMGHWHQSLWLPRVIVANTLKGYDEFAKLFLRAPVSVPSQPLFFVHPRYGITSRWEIYLSDPQSPAAPWISVFDEVSEAA